jgi:glycosyltransferase involved in cell wall biosynthesis
MGENITKLLFIVSEFYQSGTSRFTFEIDKALDKTQVETSILCVLPLDSDKRWNSFYHKEHSKLNSKVFFLKEIDKVYEPSILQRFRRKFFGAKLPSERKHLIDFLDSFDAISIMGEYNYPFLQAIIPSQIKEKTLIHSQNSIIQRPDNYDAFNKSDDFCMVNGFRPVDCEFEFQDFDLNKIEHIYLPLSFEIKEDRPNWRFRKSDKKKIGIFTRLTSAKPLDVFLIAFQSILRNNPDFEFHIFGTGDPNKEGVSAKVSSLEIADKVFFRGHQQDIKETAVLEKLDLVWLHGYHSVPGGWVGYDICTLGIPQVFWDFGGQKIPVLLNTFPVVSSQEEFVSLSNRVLADAEFAQDLGRKEFDFVKKNHEIKINIKPLVNKYKKMRSS